jgi:hypothetical protein
MQKAIERLLNGKYGVKIDEVALAILNGNFRVTEIETSMNGGFIEKRFSLIVEGAEVEIELGRFNGLGGMY